jgi:SAM-dependent methyltransferase
VVEERDVHELAVRGSGRVADRATDLECAIMAALMAAEPTNRGPNGAASEAGPALASWPADGLEHVASCPACGSGARAVLHDELEDRTFRSAPGRWRLLRCGGCGSAYLDPRPTRATVGLAYRTYFTHEEDPGAAATADGARAALANGLLNARWGYSAEPATRLGTVAGRLLPARGALVARSVRHLPATPGGRLLDVGSGSGSFVAQMARLGWQAEGLEPDPQAVAVARNAGLTIAAGSVDDLEPRAAADGFDAVTLSHVIEHLHDPESALHRIWSVLRPGGTLWVATPNLRSLGHRRFGRDWLALDAPRHLTLFHRTSLESLLRRCGFETLPAPRPTSEAALTFGPSAAIRAGRPTAEGPERPRAIRALAAVADFVAARDPDVAEELVVLARRPEVSTA